MVHVPKHNKKKKKKFMKIYATIFNEYSCNMNNSYCFIDFRVHIVVVFVVVVVVVVVAVIVV